MFDTLIIHPITNMLVAIYQLFSALRIPSSLAFSIIALTVLIRFILYPLINSQMKAAKKMQEAQPHINKLKEKHKGNAQMLQQETMKLYKELGINPAAGCLPLLIQLPVIWGLYSVLSSTVAQTSVAGINKVLYFEFLKLPKMWDTMLFGLSISAHPADLIKNTGPLILLVPVVTGLLQYVQSRLMAPDKKISEQSDEKKKTEPDFASMMQTQTMYILPVMIGFFSYSLPLGLSLYWNTFTVFGIVQQYLTNKKAKGLVLLTK